jgi:exosortase/archaeosortase family protein
MSGGEGVRMVYSCIGYGVMSFWAAFIIANRGSWKKKTAWIAGGLTAIFLINVLRLSLLLLAAQKHWAIPFGWDHHTWFNIVAYSFIFGMIYFYDRSIKKTSLILSNQNANQNLQALS